MTGETAEKKVLIIGAGIGGLVLAQSLRKYGIPFEIFERDKAQKSRRQGWAILLIECLDDLAAHLPSDLGDMYQTSVNAGIDERDSLAFVDANTGKTLGSVGTENKLTPGGRPLLRVGREAFRNFLWNHTPVSTGKRFSHYVEDDKGVTAYFEDGTSSRGAILVGADGASSRVRAQLLGPKAVAEIVNLIPLFGECTLTREQYAPFAAIANAGFIAGGDNFRFLFGRRSIAIGGDTADYFFVLALFSTDPARDSAWTRNATQKELFDKCMELVADKPSIIRDPIVLTGPEGMVTSLPHFSEFVPPNAMPWSRVTLLGDAAHVMSPAKGAGANTAISDATDMASLLVQQHAQPQSPSGHNDNGRRWLETIATYNEVMVRRGRHFVLASREAGNSGSATTVGEGRAWNPAMSAEKTVGRTVAAN